MRVLHLLIFLLLSTIGIGQCDIFIVPNSAIVIDHNPGISFAFEVQNNSTTPYFGGDLYLDWALSSNSVWNFDFNTNPITPGTSRYVSTPSLDIPLPGNVPDNWSPYGGWSGTEYIPYFKLSLIGNYECFEWVLDSEGNFWNQPLSDGCENPNGDNFCDDQCNLELIDFNLETAELTIIPNSTYCPNLSSFSWSNQYPYDNPYVFGFQLNFNLNGNSITVSVGGQQIYESDESIIISLDNTVLTETLNDILEAIDNGEYCELTLTLFNANNSGQQMWEANENQTIELIDLCPVVDDYVDLALDTILYDIGCDGLDAYWSPTFYFINEGEVPITEFCITEDILGTLAGDDTICFDSFTIPPGETYELEWPNMYEWGVLTVRVIDVNGESEQSWNDFGLDNDIGDNMYVQIVTDEPDCEPEEIPGCTIEQACNYNPEATISDNSCDFESCQGCMDPEASNYDPEATINNPSSCVYDILGCTDETAFNYNPFATVDDGGCIPVICGCLIPSALNFDPLANSQCLPVEESCIFPIYGCTDETANNFNPEANSDDESCTYDVLGCIDSSALNFNPLANIDDGSCEYDVFGCTNPFASNYNPLATVDDGSCVIYLGGCTDPEALNYNFQATEDDGSCVYNSCDGGYFAPNTFTPNNDGVNDGWSIVTDGDCWLEWQCFIFDRWGRLVWESNIPGEIWEGSNYNGSYYVADGIYVYTIKGIGYNPSHTFEKSGYITIFR